MVGMARFERAALWSQTRCATMLRYIPENKKTPCSDYALQGLSISLGRNARLELTAPWATTRCSAN